MKYFSLIGSLFVGLSFHALATDPYTQIHSFSGNTTQHGSGDGSVAYSPIQGKDGFLYGTTQTGGTVNKGVIYKATTSGTLTVLHNFSDGSVANDGSQPYATLVQGKDGNFYGTTAFGGTVVAGQMPNGGGTVFKITPAGVYSVIHRFNYTVEGINPHAPLIQSTDGNFYGTTYSGGTGFSFGGGCVFKMTPAGATTMISNFPSADGSGPRLFEGPVTEGKDGLLYGAATFGGIAPSYGGSIYSVSKTGVVKVLHNFGDPAVTNDGSAPTGSLFQDTDGSFYGVTPQSAFAGNAYQGAGAIFKLTTAGKYSLIHSFGDLFAAGSGPVKPVGGLTKGADGYFYGVTANGGLGIGTIYRVTTGGVLTVLHQFGANGDGSFPGNSNLVQATDGALYGATASGGSGSNGGLYRYKLPAVPTAAPVISSANKATGFGAKAFSYQMVASNTPDSFTASTLPAGLTFNAGTGLISGTPTVVGTFAIKLTATNVKGTGNLTLNLTIAQNTQTITFAAIPSQVVGTKITLAATASSGLPVTYTLVSGTALIAGRVLRLDGAGAVTVRATQAGNTLYKAAAAVTTSVVVVKKTQTITFPTIGTKVLGVAPFKLTATASSKLAVTYAVVGPAKISGSTITVTGAGNIKVTASQAGNATYGSTAITQYFLVTAKK